MAILTEETSAAKSRILTEGMPPKGTHIAVCIENEDFMNYQRFKYQSNELETVNLTRFYFAFIKADKRYIVRTRLYKISLHEKSALLPFLSAWTGEPPPPGFDTRSLIGRAAQVTIAHTASPGNGKIYANISAIAPLMEGLEDKVPDPKTFAAFLGPYAPLPPARMEPGVSAVPVPVGPSGMPLPFTSSSQVALPGASGMPKQNVSMDDLAGPAPASIRQRLAPVSLDDIDEIPF